MTLTTKLKCSVTVKLNFTVTEHLNFDPLEFQFWQYHLYPNSNITLSIHTDIFIDVLIIKGKANIDRWSDSPNSDIAEESFERISLISTKFSKRMSILWYFTIHYNPKLS